MNSHVIYLAVIVVLIIVLVFVSAKLVRAHRVMTRLEERFGLKETVRSSLPRPEPLRKAKAGDLLRPRTFDQYRREVDGLLARAQALEEFGKPTALSAACAKALVGGKRLRPVILLEVARATALRRQKADAAEGASDLGPIDAGEAALFIEYLHAASLVVDDLPEFDNDTVRRGRPSLHSDVGPAVAQMAALSLIAAAFQNICRQIDWIRDNCPEMKNVDRIGTRLCDEVSRAIGVLGAAGGQYMDISSQETLTREHGADALTKLATQKTASFFEIAVVAGWLAAGGDADQTGVMRDIGLHVGRAFQIADDIGDMDADAARIEQGKPGWNYANEYGRDIAAREMERNLKGARLLLVQMSLWTPLWDEVYAQIRDMAAVAPAAGAPVASAPAAATAASPVAAVAPAAVAATN